jgi:undecaprenyl-diphosphatase
MDFDELLVAAILGLVEGLTEFIPVSSTGHLILAQNWLGYTGAKADAFIIFIQLGAILAVVWLYRAKFWGLATTWPKEGQSRRLIVNLVLATMPAVIVGLPTEDYIEKHLFKPLPVAAALVAGGVAILLVERKRKRVTVATVDEIPLAKAIGVGLFQVLAILFPGVSRSGATIMGGLALGLSRTAAAEFSFFMAIPAMFGASLIKLIKVRDDLDWSDVPMFAIGFLVAFVSALIVIRWLLAYVARHSFAPFAWYRIVLGGALLLAWLVWGYGIGETSPGGDALLPIPIVPDPTGE